MARKKIALIGGGQIGGTLAHLMAQRHLGDIVLFDIVEDLSRGKMLDIFEASPILGFDLQLVGSSRDDDIRGADLIVVTAGLARKPGMSRDDLITVNSKVITSVSQLIREHAPDSFVILLTNPLDAMVSLCRKVTGFPRNRIMGMAGVLDSARFAAFIAHELGVSMQDVHALVLGGHGDDMVPLVRFANVAGIPVTYLLEQKYGSQRAKQVMDELVSRTRRAGGEIVGLMKTSAFVSPASAAFAMAESILLDRKRIMPVCAMLEGEYGVDGYFVGVPCVLGADGVERIIELDLTTEERAMFDESVSHVKSLANALNL
ncbi:MAG TPA: malate dehydrogenase [Geobacteraceae bacterium]|nr:malate dehydrogenase [Geobacteraceae bacterium]